LKNIFAKFELCRKRFSDKTRVTSFLTCVLRMFVVGFCIYVYPNDAFCYADCQMQKNRQNFSKKFQKSIDKSELM
jgi:hypothetical protein